MKSCIESLCLALLLAGLAPVAWASIITPQLGGFIDPVGGAETDGDATGSDPLSTFSALSDLVIQANWTGIGGTTGNTIDHDAGGTDDGVDVRIEHTTPFSASASSSSSYNSAGVGTGYLWTGDNAQQLTILFGTQNGSFSNDRTVKAAGLMLMNFGGAYPDVTINYLDSADGVLSTQSFSGGADSEGSGGADYFTGYISSSQNIAKMTIDITRNTGTSSIGLDALTYAVPEPSSFALLGLGAIVWLTLRRCRAAYPRG